jgi:hypothetical protein
MPSVRIVMLAGTVRFMAIAILGDEDTEDNGVAYRDL